MAPFLELSAPQIGMLIFVFYSHVTLAGGLIIHKVNQMSQSFINLHVCHHSDKSICPQPFEGGLHTPGCMCKQC